MEQKMYRINEQLNLIYTQKEERSLRSREIQESFSVLYLVPPVWAEIFEV